MKLNTSYEDYKKAQAGLEGIKLGDHCAVIKNAYETERSGYSMIIIEFDFSHSDVQEGLIGKKSEGLDYWHQAGQYSIFLNNDYTLSNIKRLATALEESNKGYKFVKQAKGGIDIDLDGCVGKEVGVCMGLVEFEYKRGDKAGEIGKAARCRYFKDVNKVDFGENIPEVKTLNGSSSSSDASKDSDGFNKIEDADVDNLPFV